MRSLQKQMKQTEEKLVVNRIEINLQRDQQIHGLLQEKMKN